MYWLIRGDTRAARLAILRLRIEALRFGDDFAETYLAVDAAIYGIVCLLPGDTTGGSKSFHVIANIVGGDLGLGALFTILAVGLGLSALRLIPNLARQCVLVATFAVWIGMAVGFFLGYAWSLGPWISVLNAFAAWIGYLRADQ